MPITYMKTTFLGQGFGDESPNGIGYYLMKFLNCTDFTSFTAITAFASEAEFFGLSELFKTNGLFCINRSIGTKLPFNNWIKFT